MSSDRETSSEGLLTVLKDIKTANGYALDIALATREFKSVHDLDNHEFPAIILFDTAEESIQEEGSEFDAAVAYITLAMGCVNDPHPSRAMNLLDQQLKKAIHENRNLGGTATYAEFLPLKLRTDTREAPLGVFLRPVRIHYDGDINAGL